MVGVKLQVIKIFTERKDRTSIFSSPDVCKEISNQSEAKKKVPSQYTVQQISHSPRVQSLRLESGSGNSHFPKLDSGSGVRVVLINAL